MTDSCVLAELKKIRVLLEGWADRTPASITKVWVVEDESNIFGVYSNGEDAKVVSDAHSCSIYTAPLHS